MARQESEREDLFAEATALVRRAEVRGVGFPEPIVAGFKRDGSLSIYFGADPAYHLNAEGRLKRAYRGGLLYRTQGHTLAELMRERTSDATVLRRRDLSPAECEAFLAEMRHLLGCLCVQLDRGKATILRQIPPDDQVFGSQLESALLIASRLGEPVARHFEQLAPRIKGKR